MEPPIGHGREYWYDPLMDGYMYAIVRDLYDRLPGPPRKSAPPKTCSPTRERFGNARHRNFVVHDDKRIAASSICQQHFHLRARIAAPYTSAQFRLYLAKPATTRIL